MYAHVGTQVSSSTTVQSIDRTHVGAPPGTHIPYPEPAGAECHQGMKWWSEGNHIAHAYYLFPDADHPLRNHPIVGPATAVKEVAPGIALQTISF
jgi:hypothetical protein